MTRLLSSLLLSSLALAVELPLASPHARVTQTLGFTDVTVEYSSPAVRGRAIWGALVPYDQPWRAGANAATRVTFSRDVTIAGKRVPAGSYALFVIPRQGSWTLILDQDHRDVVRVEAKPETVPFRERLTYLFADFGEDGGTLQLEWEKLRVSLPIAVDTASQLSESLTELEQRGWEPYNEVAIYQLEQKHDPAAALTWVERSLRVGEDWFNVWTKARILAAKGARHEAGVWAQKAARLGATAPRYHNHADELARAIKEWN